MDSMCVMVCVMVCVCVIVSVCDDVCVCLMCLCVCSQPSECSSKDSHGVVRANSPLVIAWSSSGRNHFIPLIPVKGKPLPKLPPSLLPKVWGLEEELLHK